MAAFLLSVGELIALGEPRMRAEFFFDFGCPFSYLAAERLERMLGPADWIPTPASAVQGAGRWADPRSRDAAREQAESRAAALRLPLIWPERFPAGAPRALRAAAGAGERGDASAFALAGLRLAFCGGFDLEDPEVLAEAAAAAGLSLEACLAAAGDERRDGSLRATGERLRERGARELPAVRIGDRLIAGERGLVEAAALWRPVGWRGAARSRPRAERGGRLALAR